MSSISREQREVLAYIDAILAMTEKSPSNNLTIGANISLNPFNFLMEIISKKVSFEDMLDWLVNIITKSLPTIELGVKGVLLANLKATIDCNNDPRIPYWIRKNGFNDEGFYFNIRGIDFKNLMFISPLSDEGSANYFGTKTHFTINGDENDGKKYATRLMAASACVKQGLPVSKIVKHSECDNVYQLARAEDFNAFLWFAIHKGYFPPSTNGDGGFNIYAAFEGDEKLTSPESKPTYKPGDILFKNNIVSLCIQGETEEPTPYTPPEDDEYYDLTSNYIPEVVVTAYAPRNYKYQFVPVSNDNFSVNWYVNNGTFFNFLKKEEDRIPRDYSKEYPICNLQFYKQLNELKFTILPKPVVHIPILSSGEKEPLWRFKTILFDADGNPSPKGKYSTTEYDINEDGSYVCNDKNSLYECYPGLTVYEFNYDYIMGMQLFDPTVVASQLIESVMNIKYNYTANVGVGVKVNKSETAYQMRVAEIVKNIVESTAYEVSDCFYTFDNAKYDSMLRDAELKRSQLYVENDGNINANKAYANDVYDILNEFDNGATLNENKDVIKRAITQATAKITEEVLPEDKYSIQFNIIQDLIKSLVLIIVETLISPKIVLLFEVNRALMGQEYTKYNIEDFLKSIEGLLVSIVREVRDLILQELLNWCLKILLDLNVLAVSMLVKEQLEYYSRLMKLLFKACSFKSSRRAALENELDHVDYADIDEIDRPKESNC